MQRKPENFFLCGEFLAAVELAEITATLDAMHQCGIDRAPFTHSAKEFAYQLMSGRACKHCGIKTGMYVRAFHSQEQPDSEDSE